MENFAILCPELAFKIEYYADAAACQLRMVAGGMAAFSFAWATVVREFY